MLKPVMNDNRRHFTRVRFAEPIEFNQSLKNDEALGCLSSDLSEGGIKLNVHDFVPVQTLLTVRLKINGHHYEIPAKVSWCEKHRFNDRYNIGVEFINDEAIQLTRSRMRQFIKAHKE